MRRRIHFTVFPLILHPSSSGMALGSNGTETQANFNFFNLYTSSSTHSALIPNASNGSDITDETYNVETDLSYYHRQMWVPSSEVTLI